MPDFSMDTEYLRTNDFDDFVPHENFVPDENFALSEAPGHVLD
jgi:hypothetical protein